ncbi:MAG: hypothetical protein K9M44_03190 [Candidatus Pacebacteria bacterium]|nr:hypothetical protein [Candidatus Paceibacterota bacterium]
MDLNSLPKPGADFKAKIGPSSFAYKLKSLVRYGKYNNLDNNLEAIIDTIDDYEDYIQKGGLSRSLYFRAWSKIKRRSEDLTRDDEREIKKILQYLRG